MIEHDRPISEPNDVELDRLLEVIFERYHYDFRRYSRPFLRRRLARTTSLAQGADIRGLHRSVAQPAIFSVLLRELALSVTDFFRDPDFYRALRQQVIPHLATYPSLRCWVAGCGTGEEAYSIAILLHEEGLLDRSVIYATDINPVSLRVAAAGTYESQRIRDFSANYFRADGRRSPSDYYRMTRSHATLKEDLRRHIVFADHCLATDAAFAELQLVTCRNVLIYFDRELQDRALGLFRDSLCPRGFLGLGANETLAFSRQAEAFSISDADQRIYRRTGDHGAARRTPEQAYEIRNTDAARRCQTVVEP